jgi:hypothetical protein
MHPQHPMHPYHNGHPALPGNPPTLHGLGSQHQNWYEHPAAIVTGLLIAAWIFMPR